MSAITVALETSARSASVAVRSDERTLELALELVEEHRAS